MYFLIIRTVRIVVASWGTQAILSFTGDTEQLVMHSKTICEAFNPTQTGSIVIDPDWVAVPFTVYT
jgi:hypothetical protein